MVLSVITDTDINNAEKYVRECLPNILKNKTGKKLSQAEKAFIFGKNHATSPDTFCFTPGERIMIRRISEYLQKNILKPFSEQIKKMNYSAEKTVSTSLGTIFGNEIDLRFHITTKPLTNAKECLLQKTKDKLKEFDVAAPVELLTEEMIVVDDFDSSKIKGQVKCIYCNEHISKVSVKYSRSSYSWVMSNFTTHLKSCKKANEKKRK